MIDNPFLAVAQRQTSAPVKALRRAAEKRAPAKALTDKDTQAKAWRVWRRERRDALLTGPYGADARVLRDFLRSMTLASAAALVDAVRSGPWGQADADTRCELLRLIDDAIVALRERHGLPPFDDALPGDAPTAFLQLRELLQ